MKKRDDLDPSLEFRVPTANIAILKKLPFTRQVDFYCERDSNTSWYKYTCKKKLKLPFAQQVDTHREWSYYYVIQRVKGFTITFTLRLIFII